MTIKQYAARVLPMATTASMLVAARGYAQISKGIESTSGAVEDTATLDEIIERVVKVLLFIVGVAAVIMLIVGGIRYVVSGGDQQAVTNAKNTILYAIVGIIVAIVAYALVNFVFDQLTGNA